MHRFDQAHLTARLDDCFDCSHLEAQPNTPSGIRKEESTTTIPLGRELNFPPRYLMAAKLLRRICQSLRPSTFCRAAALTSASLAFLVGLLTRWKMPK